MTDTGSTFRRRSPLLRLAEGLLLAGLLLRSAIPAGYMLDYGAIVRGSSPVVMCPSGFPLLDLGAGHDHHGEDPPETVDHRGVQCVFAAAALLAVAFVALGLVALPWRFRPGVPEDAAIRAGELAHPAWSARAPPRPLA